MLTSERAAIGGGTSGRSAVQLIALARHLGRTDDPAARQLLSSAYVREHVLDLLQARVIGGSRLPARGPLPKLLYSEPARRTGHGAVRRPPAVRLALPQP